MSSQVKTDIHPGWFLDNYPLFSPHKLYAESMANGIPMDRWMGKVNSFTEVRGRYPSTGWVLMAWRDLKNLVPFEQPTHTLVINDESRTVAFNDLSITAITAAYPAVSTTPTTPHDSQLFVVQLQDTRRFAPWSYGDGKFSYRDADNELRDPKSWADIVDTIWNGTGTPGSGLQFIGPLGVSGNYPTHSPESFQYHGTTAYDAFFQVTDHLNAYLAPTLNAPGYTLFNLDAGSFVDPAQLNTAYTRTLLDQEQAPRTHGYPSEILVYFHSRDYQQHGENYDPPHPDAGKDEVPADWWRTQPVYSLAVPTTKHILDQGERDRIIAGATAPLWSSVPWITNDNNEIVNTAQLEESADLLARDYLNRLQLRNHTDSFTFSGCWPTQVGTTFSGVSYYDLGLPHDQGLKTKWFSRPECQLDEHNWNRDPVALSISNEYPGPPDINRNHAPYAREFVGTLIPPEDYTPPTDDPCQPICPGSPLPEDTEGMLLPEKKGNVRILLFEGDGEEQKPRDYKDVEAYNTLDCPIPYGKRVVVRWNYQLETGGAWQITSWCMSAAGQIQQQCIANENLIHVECVTQPEIITARKNNMLRVQTRNWPNGIREAVLSLYGGPQGSVLQSCATGDGPLYWTKDLALDGHVSIGDDKWYRWAPSGNRIGMGGPIHFKFPSFSGARGGTWPTTGGFLAAKTGGGLCVETHWVGPGINTTVTGYQCSDFEWTDCEACGPSSRLKSSATCVSMTFKSGLLQSITGVPYTQEQAGSSGDCDIEFDRPWNPCCPTAASGLPCNCDTANSDECDPSPDPTDPNSGSTDPNTRPPESVPGLIPTPLPEEEQGT